MSLNQLMVKIILICHVFACIWFAVADQNQDQVNWISYYNLSDASTFSLYLNSFYWAAMTMVTVGYGDITPKNNVELICANVTMFLACGVFAFSINSIGVMVQQIYKNQSDYKEKVHLINQFLLKFQINKKLQAKIKSYLEYIWKEEKQQYNEEVSEIVSKLSKSLQDELQFELKGNILNKSKVFSKFSTLFLKDLTHYMEEIRFSPEDIIFSEHEKDDSSIYFITKGEVSIFYENPISI